MYYRSPTLSQYMQFCIRGNRPRQVRIGPIPICCNEVEHLLHTMRETVQKFHKYALNASELDISLEFPGDFKAFKAYLWNFCTVSRIVCNKCSTSLQQMGIGPIRT